MFGLIILIIGMAILTAICACQICRNRSQRRQIAESDHLGELILRNIDAYVLLIDSAFDVLRTNYYILTNTPQSARRLKVGNLLRCKNGEDAGVCGTHDLCADCPVRAAISRSFSTRQSFSKLEAPMVLYTTPDHTQAIECEVSVTGNYITLDDKPHMLLTVHDITAQKQIQRDLTEARIRAEESDRMKSFFLTNISHELRTPLNAIHGFSELLAADPTPEEKQEYMRVIRLNNDLLLQQVNDILDLSKIEAGGLEFEYTEVELNAVMEELEGGFRLRQPEDDPVRITFRKLYPACYVRADRKRLTQVIANFMSNAVKFTASGSIDLGFEIRGEAVYIYVTDTGTGISEEHQQQLFKRFVKVGSHKQGVGIGLAISKSIIESMGGQIGVVSEAGKGSTFWFTLPCGTEQ